MRINILSHQPLTETDLISFDYTSLLSRDPVNEVSVKRPELCMLHSMQQETMTLHNVYQQFMYRWPILLPCSMQIKDFDQSQRKSLV